VPVETSMEALVKDLVDRFGPETHGHLGQDHGRLAGAPAGRARLAAKR
jgi:hypothetical protein